MRRSHPRRVAAAAIATAALWSTLGACTPEGTRPPAAPTPAPPTREGAAAPSPDGGTPVSDLTLRPRLVLPHALAPPDDASLAARPSDGSDDAVAGTAIAGSTTGSAGAGADGGASGTPSGAEGDACPADVAVRDGDALAVAGRRFTFFGVNYQYALDPAYPEERVEPMLGALSDRGVNAVRVWFLPHHDPERFARLIEAAGRHRIRLIVALADNVHVGRNWFFGQDDEEVFRPHARTAAARHARRPEILAWEPVNEPNCGERFDEECVDNIKDWLVMAARLLREADPCHLVSSGMIGAGNYDFEHAAYRRIHRGDGPDVASVHRRVGQDAERERETAEENERPIVYGEVYDRAYDESCTPLDGGRELRRRAGRVADDLRDALGAGVDGYLLWDVADAPVERDDGTAGHFCGVFAYERDDPLWPELAADGLPPEPPWR